MSMDCACCGLAIERVGDYYTEDEEIVCTGCGATNVVFIATISASADEYAYFGAWHCSHGVSGDEPCDQCEVEHGVAV